MSPRFATGLRMCVAALVGLGTASVSVQASAAPPTAEPTAETDASAKLRGKSKLSKRKHKPWIKRWAPERHMVELGPYVGALFPSRKVELFEPSLVLPDQGFKRFETVGPEVGGRFGYFPIRFFGLEIEGGWSPTRTRDDGFDADLWMVRGHGIAQIGLWSVTPFVLVGGGIIAARSERYAVGNDIDQALHVGGGLKFYVHRYLAVRLDVRDIVSPARGIRGGASNNLEVLLGLSLTFGRKRDTDDKPPEDTPAPAADRDGDGFPDDKDKCPDQAGIAPDGCPPPGDRDGDGFDDASDQCPDEPGIAPAGCPDPDPDKDGILGKDDACPDQPENRNGFEDNDGCPDDLPEEVKRFQGTLEGIYFDVGKATLRPQSKTKLDETVAIMKKYPDVRVEISGHTDSTGSRDFNMELSRQRAESVKAYLVANGITAERVQTRGAGPDEPIDSNASKDGRSKNRRIEFRVLD